jgi:4-hydroxythreonine-4-phosphate dehydrogenase
MGDPSGVGPEIVAKLWADGVTRRQARLLLLGDAGCMAEAFRLTHTVGGVRSVADVGTACFDDQALDVLDLGNVDLGTLQRGRVQAASGKAAYQALERAIALASAGEIAAVVTAPLNKEALNRAGYHYAGHTEILAGLTNTPRVTMMLVAGAFRVTHVSTHCSLSQAIARVTRGRVLDVIELTHRTVCQLGVVQPRIAVAGLNPHAGEGGLFGREEIDEIQPAIADAISRGLGVAERPVPPDTVFYRMAGRHEFDAVVAMYHDQGHIPTKLLGFAEGVNVTLGLPIIRTSVDHGTAFDIAGQGIADATSLRCAVGVALQLAQGQTGGA